ncbi:type II toxin-antitoxin system RelE/ParE family toxin [Sphaerotilus microaerophilus]|jgi:putative addiction module killer protein|uniref:Toxin, RelE family protein n=1 Tax=Sphaerotilus microaerophilus TaxID=2914710 RepID=A0ABM7YSM5_9BURK|nr:type II toxin-antitoxin system RelE/ParE family toxin [Sphaerotilus sp. FB-5]BDI07567.1 toxin, RelE family protein [Sphaerotilus sp. FB-5]
MIEIRKTQLYQQWFDGLRDKATRLRLEARVRRLSLGNPGQHRVLTGGVTEMKLDHGPGYRVYYAQRGSELVLLLVGGDKASQQRDIDTAVQLAKEWQP